ncbi:MAG: hypothetical protein ABEH65_07725 [Halobacteriales archaeon]
MTSDNSPSSLNDPLTDPLQLIDAQFEQLETLCGLFIRGFPDIVSSTASELQALEQKPRFTRSSAVFRNHLHEQTEGPVLESILASVNDGQLSTFGRLYSESIQRVLVLQALEASEDPMDHLILIAALQILIDGFTEIPDLEGEDREELLSAQLGVLSKLHELTEHDQPALTDSAIRDIAIGEYHFYRITDERVDRHPDTVPIPGIAPDMAVYGAALAYDKFGVTTDRAASLANEDHEEFIEILASYGIDTDH